jgi:hypothetical protein
MTAAAVVVVAVVTVPGAEYHAQSSASVLGNSFGGAAERQLQVLTDNQAAALRYIGHSPRPGAVLAPQYLSMSIPEFTGRRVFAGHQMWEPSENLSEAASFFDPALKDPTGALRRTIFRRSGATFVIGDCAPRALGAALARVAPVVKRFGCVTVYERS